MNEVIDYREYIYPAVRRWKCGTVNVVSFFINKRGHYYNINIHTRTGSVIIVLDHRDLAVYLRRIKEKQLDHLKFEEYIENILEAKTKHIVEKQEDTDLFRILRITPINLNRINNEHFRREINNAIDHGEPAESYFYEIYNKKTQRQENGTMLFFPCWNNSIIEHDGVCHTVCDDSPRCCLLSYLGDLG